MAFNELLKPWHSHLPTEDELARRAREDGLIGAETLLAAIDESTALRRYSRRGRRVKKVVSTTLSSPIEK